MTDIAQVPVVPDQFQNVASPATIRVHFRSLVEVLLWGILGLVAAFFMLALRPSPLSNDSYQYLSVAANIGHGNGIATDLVYFDTERSHGRIPSPLTTFPPGYPAAVAALTGVAGNSEIAARILSAICFAGTAVLLAFMLISARVTAWVRAAMLLLFLTNFVCASYSDAVLTELMFVFLFLAAIAALSWAWRNNQHPRISLTWTIAGMTLAGLSCWVRYAGLFLIAALVLCAALRFVWVRSRSGAFELCAALIPVGMAGALMARNYVLVGNWKGGNNLPVSNPLRGVLADAVRAQLHLLLGEHAVKFGIWEGLLLVGSLGLCTLLGHVILRNRMGGGVGRFRLNWLWALPLACGAIYSAGVFYAGLHTVISFGTRMFLPVLPIYLLLLGLILHWMSIQARFRGRRVWFWTTLCALVVGYIGVNARDLNMPRGETRQHELSILFADRTADGVRLSDWLNAHTTTSSVIAAQDGQAIGYLLQRPTLGLVEAEYSAERWDCKEIRVQMNRFDARYLIIYRHPDPHSHLVEESSFVAEASTGQPTCGFVIAAENPEVRVLEMEPLTGVSGRP